MKALSKISQNLYNIGLFSHQNTFEQSFINEVQIHINFRQIAFEKKHMLSLLFLLFILSNQKPNFKYSKKNVILYRIQKGDVVGIFISLRKDSIKNFFTLLEKLNLKPKMKFLLKIRPTFYRQSVLQIRMPTLFNNKKINWDNKILNLIFFFETKSFQKQFFLLSNYLPEIKQITK